MSLHLLPDRVGRAAENMALDFLLLQRYPQSLAPRFRHYTWQGPAFTFGYSQKIAFVRSQLPADTAFDLCRRPTGGGIVDHRHDWTYAFVLPRGHPLEELPAPQSYRTVHESLATALRLQGVPAGLQSASEAGKSAAASPPTIAGVCFQRAECHDVIHEQTQRKIAGGAQKRNKHGLLFQGSIEQAATGLAVDWEKFREDFVASLAESSGLIVEPTPWPEFGDDEAERLAEHYSTPEWIEFR